MANHKTFLLNNILFLILFSTSNITSDIARSMNFPHNSPHNLSSNYNNNMEDKNGEKILSNINKIPFDNEIKSSTRPSNWKNFLPYHSYPPLSGDKNKRFFLILKKKKNLNLLRESSQKLIAPNFFLYKDFIRINNQDILANKRHNENCYDLNHDFLKNNKQDNFYKEHLLLLGQALEEKEQKVNPVIQTKIPYNHEKKEIINANIRSHERKNHSIKKRKQNKNKNPQINSKKIREDRELRELYCYEILETKYIETL